MDQRAAEHAAPAFVAGATGFTGREVVRVLRARGVRTLAHVRPDSPQLGGWRERFAALGAETDTTPWEAAAMSARLRDLAPTLVFALLGTTRSRGRVDGSTYESVDYGLTVLLLEAAASAAARTGAETAAPRFVYLSSAGVAPGAKSAYFAAR